ncbi:Mitochondrial fission 1 protein A [Morella rubra]|uniref:Mitochondrial fission 1 protein A n=1 Tax=Morella rubra TaxID=262757 RepID=A0A6A1UIN3_9ROSI|nr:Mitochondrial fission 1 protein A [Morella rubra]
MSKNNMEAKIGKFFSSVSNFFSGGEQIPWCDNDVVALLAVSSCATKLKANVSDLLGFDDTVCQVPEYGDELSIFCHIFGVFGASYTAGCEREVAEAEKGSSDELLNDCIMRLSWALVHSRRPEDVQRGIAMLQASLASNNSPLQTREKLYLLAVGHYRSGDCSRSRELVEQCLVIAPDWRQAQTLKKTIEGQIKKDGVIGIGIATAGIGLIAGGLAAALSRKK